MCRHLIGRQDALCSRRILSYRFRMHHMSNASSQEVKLFAEGWKELKAESVFEIRASYLARDLLLSAENLRVALPEPGTCPIPQLS